VPGRDEYFGENRATVRSAYDPAKPVGTGPSAPAPATRLFRAQFDRVSDNRVSRLGKFGRFGFGLHRASDVDGIEQVGHGEARGSLHIDQLVTGRRRHVDASPHEGDQQELGDPGGLEIERHNIAADTHPFSIEVRDERSRITLGLAEGPGHPLSFWNIWIFFY